MSATTLKEYIEEQQSIIVRANCSDNRPTTQAELDSAASEYTEGYKRGQVLMRSLTEKLVERCRLLYRHQHPSSLAGEEGELMHEFVLGKWVVAPRYLFLIEEVRALQEIFRD